MKRTWLYVVLAVFSSWPLTYADSHPPITLDDSLVWTAAIDETADKVNDDIKPTAKFYPVTKALVDDLKGLWAVTGPMSKPRVEHTATLLSNGQVLVVGGYYNDGASRYLATAELYNPATSTWAITGSLAQARTRHTATKLANGKVLVAGGLFYNGVAYQVLNSAAIYDPATGAWTTTGVMKLGRYWHTATLLADGKVLVVGGSSNPNNSTISTNNAELYDSATGTWSLVAAMSTARVYHTATLLNNGKVLITGGQNSVNGVLADAVTYDPTSRVWSSVGIMSTPRVFHSATLLRDGKVLITGGYKALNIPLPLKNDLFDPSPTGVNHWSIPASGLVAGRYSHTATMLYTGRILVTGGVSNAAFGVELYDPVITKIWKQATAMSLIRYGHTASLLTNGKVLVAGGFYYDGINHYHANSELYTPFPSGTVVQPGVGGCNTGPAAPAATTGIARDIASTSANIEGTVNDNCADTSIIFELGTTITYNLYSNSLLSAAGAGLKTYIGIAKTGLLACDTLYHYRIKAENSVGVTYGNDATFRTLACNRANLSIDLDNKRTLLSRGETYSYTALVKDIAKISDVENAVFKAPVVTGLNVTSVTCGNATSSATCPLVADWTVAKLQGTGIVIPKITKGGGVLFTINATVAAGAALGNLSYTAQIETPSNTVDINLSNNTDTDIDRVINRPDFVVTDITLTPNGNIAAQSTFDAEVTVKNQGTAPGNANILGLWLNKSGTIACKAETDAQKNIGVIAAGVSKNFIFSGLNSGLAGSKKLTVFVDSTCLTVEAKTDNNLLTKPYTVVTIPAATPDLMITSVVITPTNPIANGTFNVDIYVKNVGSIASDIAFVDVWAHKTTSPACGAFDSTKWQDLPSLAAGATTTIKFTGLPAGTTAGNKTLQTFVDSWCEVPEAQEGNNKVSKSYVVQ